MVSSWWEPISESRWEPIALSKWQLFVESFLKTTVNRTDFANAGGGFAYSFECGENETGSWHPELGRVPEVMSADTDVGEVELDFYARLLLDRDIEDEDGLDDGADGVDVRALDDLDQNETDSNESNAHRLT